MPGEKALSQREKEILAIGLTCLEHAGIDYEMMAERGGYKNAKSAREGFRFAKKKFFAVVGVNPSTGIPNESAPSAPATSATGTPSRVAPARAASARATSARATSARAASATTPLSRAKPTRASSTRTVPAKRGRRGTATSPPPSGEEEDNSDDTEDNDNGVEGDDEEDYKPPRARHPRAKKAKTSVETKVPKDDSDEAALPEKLNAHDHHGDGEATTHDNGPEEESSAMVPNLQVELKEEDGMDDNNAGKDAHAPDAKPKEEPSVATPTPNAETKEQTSMDNHNAGEDAEAPNAKPMDTGDVAMTENVDAKENGKAISIGGKLEAETAQAHQGADHQTEGIYEEMDNVSGETKEEAVAGADQGVDNKNTSAVLTYDGETQGAPAEPQSGEAADPVVLDEMADILMQAAALETQMRANEELASKESKA